ncbi:MAG: T9SS type A sorting domain-containing protein, partial [Bacteroidota bacterium]
WNAVNNGISRTDGISLAINGGNVFAAMGPRGVLYSVDNGSNWNAFNEDLTIDNETNAYALSLAFTEKDIFAGTRIGIWRRPLSEITTGIERGKENVTAAFSLEQNYPNPFNPATTISFSIPRNAYVSLKVFNNLGEEVRTLINEVKPCGVYQIEFDASILPGGVYFYRLQSGDLSETKKLILLR